MTQKKKQYNSKNKLQTLSAALYNIGLAKERRFFIENLSLLLSAGMDVLSALESIKKDIESHRMRNITERVLEEVESGVPLSSALGKSQLFSEHVLSLIRLGEISGRLMENLQVIVLQNEKELLFKSRIQSALLYTGIIFSMTILVGTGTAWFVLPKIAIVFRQFNTELPAVTRGIIYIGKILAQYGETIIPLFLLSIIVIYYFLFSFSKTKFIGQALLFRLPFVKQLIQQIEIARFGFLFGTMLQTSMPITKSLISVSKTTAFLNYRKFYVHLHNKIEEGNSFQKSFALYPHINRLFPSSVYQMITTAEQSGSLPNVLLKIGTMFESRAETTAKNLPTILEPILLIIIGAGIALFALGVLFPIYNIVSIIR